MMKSLNLSRKKKSNEESKEEKREKKEVEIPSRYPSIGMHSMNYPARDNSYSSFSQQVNLCIKRWIVPRVQRREPARRINSNQVFGASPRRCESSGFCGSSGVSLIRARKMINEANLSPVYGHDQKVSRTKVVAPWKSWRRGGGRGVGDGGQTEVAKGGRGWRGGGVGKSVFDID